MSISAAPSASLGTPIYHPCPPEPSCGYCNGTIDAATWLDWSFLDGVYCISLKTRADRLAQAAAEFHKLGLCRRVTFHRPDKHPKSARIGSWEAHRAVAMHALAQGCRRVLICEDDVLFTRRVGPATLASIERALAALPEDWMIFFLGHWPLAAYFVRHNVLRTSSGCCHAYIASPRLLQWLCDHPWGAPAVETSPIAGKGVDSAFARLPQTYALFPMLAIQRASRSDHFDHRAQRPKRKHKLRHLVIRSRHRELLLSRLMRPFEVIVALLSPVFLLKALVRGRLTGRSA
jgi:GR25 family glycosyltransferase involved in LPS biosynthesis